MSDCEIHSRSAAAFVDDRVHLRSEPAEEQRGDALIVEGAKEARLAFPPSAVAGVPKDRGSAELDLPSPGAVRVSAEAARVSEGERSRDDETRRWGGPEAGVGIFASDGVRFCDAGAGGKGERGGGFLSSKQSVAEAGSFDRRASEEEERGAVAGAKQEMEQIRAPLSYSTPPRSDVLEAPEGSIRGGWMHGFEAGDMVWGKVKSHPWWPGHIFNESFASSSVRRTKREGHVLVAFFGDSSYGWFDPAELVHFDPHYSEKSRQTASRNFLKAVEEAVDEASRRCALAVSCCCRNPSNFRPAAVPGYFAVDVAGYEPGGVYSSKQIRGARDNLIAADVLLFVNQLALRPQDPEQGSIDWIKKMATILALRKALFEEFDVTYAEAFGVQPVLPSRTTQRGLDQAERLPSRAAPLSGPLVIAEALGERKAPGKAVVRAKDDSAKKNKYLFKRREEATPPAAGGGGVQKPSSSPPRVAATKHRLPLLLPSGSPGYAPAASLPPPDPQHAAPGQGTVPYSGFATGRVSQSGAPRHPPLVEAPNVHYLPHGQADVIVAAAGGGGYAEADVGNYVLQKRVPEKQQQNIPKKEESYQAAEPSGRGRPVHDVWRSKTERPGGEEVGERVLPVHEAVATGKVGPGDHGGKNFRHEYNKLGVDAKEAVGLLKTPGMFSDRDDVKLGLPLSAADQANDGLAVYGGAPSPMDVHAIREKAHKHPREDEEFGEKKKKKRKKDVESLVKVSSSGKPTGNAGIGLANYSDNSVAAGEAELKADGANDSDAPSDSAATIIHQLPKLDWASHSLDLPGVLDELSALARDLFYGAERNTATLVRHVMLRFRSLVYEKALPFPQSTEHTTTSEPPYSADKFRAARPPQEALREHASIAGEREVREQQRESVKPSGIDIKPVFKPADPAKVGRKRMPSDRQEEKLAKRLKKLENLKALTSSAEKRSGIGNNKTPDVRAPLQKDAGTALVAPPPVKTLKPDTLKRQEAPANPPKAAVPTYLVMKFPHRTTLPSVSSLKARFARFGPLDLSGTRVFWKSYTCKVLFKHKSDAQAACTYAQGNDIFGQVKVTYFVRELELPVPEPATSEPVKRHAEDAPQLRPPGGGDPTTNEPRPAAAAAAAAKHQSQYFSGQQLKSILKKPSADDPAAPAAAAVAKETPRVKFMLGGDDDPAAPAVVGSGAGAAALPSSPALLDLSDNRRIPKSVTFLPPLQPPLLPPPHLQDGLPLPPPPATRDVPDPRLGFQLGVRALPPQGRYGEMEARERGGADISHRMLSLLARCNDIVATVTSALGYVPYHPL